MKEVKKYGTKLKNRYYGEKANELNLASKAKDAAEEFRLMKNYTDLKNKQSILLSPKKLEDHFKDHFKHRPIDMPDEVINPQNYQHLASPSEIANHIVDEDPQVLKRCRKPPN